MESSQPPVGSLAVVWCLISDVMLFTDKKLYFKISNFNLFSLPKVEDLVLSKYRVILWFVPLFEKTLRPRLRLRWDYDGFKSSGQDRELIKKYSQLLSVIAPCSNFSVLNVCLLQFNSNWIYRIAQCPLFKNSVNRLGLVWATPNCISMCDEGARKKFQFRSFIF